MAGGQQERQDWGEYGSLEGQVIAKMSKQGKREVIAVYRNGSWQQVPKPGLRERISHRVSQILRRG